MIPTRRSGMTREVAAAAAKALGGEFAHERRDGLERLSLALPRNDRDMRYRVLIVDDEADSRDALAELTQRWGYDVQTRERRHRGAAPRDRVAPGRHPDRPRDAQHGRAVAAAGAAGGAARVPGGAPHRPRHHPDRGAGHQGGRLRLHREAARGAAAAHRARARAREEGDDARGAAAAAAPRRARARHGRRSARARPCSGCSSS